MLLEFNDKLLLDSDSTNWVRLLLQLDVTYSILVANLGISVEIAFVTRWFPEPKWRQSARLIYP